MLEPIVVKDGEIIDGKHRYKACLELGIEPKFMELPQGISPLDYVISKNLRRRHLTADQRAVIAQEILPMLEEEARKRQIELGRTHGSSGSAPLVEKIPQGGSREKLLANCWALIRTTLPMLKLFSKRLLN